MNNNFAATRLPVYCSSSFEWKGKKGTSNQSDLIKVDSVDMNGAHFGLLVKSAKTGEVKYFEPIYDEDGYDGEFMVYGCDDINVVIWNY